MIVPPAVIFEPCPNIRPENSDLPVSHQSPYLAWTWGCYNHLGHTVYLMDVTGVVVQVKAAATRTAGPPLNMGFRGYFYLIKTFERPNSVFPDWMNLSDADNGFPRYIQEAIARSAAQSQPAAPPYGLTRERHSYRQRIGLEELKRNRGAVYDPMSDFVVSLTDPREEHNQIVHPRSGLAMASRALVVQGGRNWQPARIVDRAQRFGDRFINIFGQVQRVVAEINPPAELQDGVYLDLGVGHGQQFYRYDDPLVTTVMFQSYELAESGGDVAGLSKAVKTLETIKAKTEQKRQDRLSRRYDERAKRRAEQIRQLKAADEIEAIQLTQEDRREEFAFKTYQRQADLKFKRLERRYEPIGNFGGLIKNVGVVLTGAVGLGSLFYKLTTNK